MTGDKLFLVLIHNAGHMYLEKGGHTSLMLIEESSKLRYFDLEFRVHSYSKTKHIYFILIMGCCRVGTIEFLLICGD